MNKLMTLMATVALVLAGRAGQMTYAPQGGENLWSDTSAWRIDGAAAGRVPTEADDVMVTDPELNAANPLTVAEDTSAAANGLILSNASETATSDPLVFTLGTNATLALKGDFLLGGRQSKAPHLLRQEPGSTLTGNQMMTAWTDQTTNSWDIAEGASATFKTYYLGRIENAVSVITNRGTVTATDWLRVGCMNGGHAYYENFGTTKVANNVHVGYSCGGRKIVPFARMTVHPGSLCEIGSGASVMSVGEDGIGELVVAGTFRYSGTRFRVGADTTSSTAIDHTIGRVVVCGDGVITNTSNNLILDTAVATRNEAYITLRDNGLWTLRPKSSTGMSQFSSGTNSYSSLVISNNASFYIQTNAGASFGEGVGSTSVVEVADNGYYKAPTTTSFAAGEGAFARAVLRDQAKFNTSIELQLGAGENSDAKMTVRDAATVEASRKILVASGANSQGELRLEGGSANVSPHASYVNGLQVGTADSVGRVTGWGALSSWNSALSASRQLTLWLKGQVVADGGTLNACCYSHINNEEGWHGVNAFGTDGWYAVSGGCVAFPRWLAVSNLTWCVGDDHALERPAMVNALTVKLTGAATGSYLCGALYAADHADVPAGLPAEKNLRPIGIWRVGYGKANTIDGPGKAVAFTSADVTVKIGLANTTVKPNRKVTIRPWRYDMAQGAWVGGESTEFDPKNPYVTFANVEPCVDAGKTGWNLGWFAVTADDSVGLVLLVK